MCEKLWKFFKSCEEESNNWEKSDKVENKSESKIDIMDIYYSWERLKKNSEKLSKVERSWWEVDMMGGMKKKVYDLCSVLYCRKALLMTETLNN